MPPKPNNSPEKNNKEKILEKIQSASQIIYLEDSNIIIEKFNAFIETINSKIKEYNIKIDNKDASLNEIKNQFWEMMKYNYDQTISIYLQDKITIETIDNYCEKRKCNVKLIKKIMLWKSNVC